MVELLDLFLFLLLWDNIGKLDLSNEVPLISIRL